MKNAIHCISDIVSAIPCLERSLSTGLPLGIGYTSKIHVDIDSRNRYGWDVFLQPSFLDLKNQQKIQSPNRTIFLKIRHKMNDSLKLMSHNQIKSYTDNVRIRAYESASAN